MTEPASAKTWSALVILRIAHQAVPIVSHWFESQGFGVSGAYARSFSITAAPELFQSALGFAPDPRVGYSDAGPAGQVVPLHMLPREISAAVELITFGRPPDFGPTAP